MNEKEKVRILEIENARLEKENLRLKEKLEKSNGNTIDEVGLLNDLDTLKKKWEDEINELIKCRQQYTALIEDVKRIKTVKEFAK